MTEIKMEPCEVIQEKLKKIRCSNGCLNFVNYLIFEKGLYCTTCLMKFPEILPQHFINVDSLSKIITNLGEEYEKNMKNGNNLVALNAEADIQNREIKALRDELASDVKTITNKSNITATNVENACEKQFRNQPLESFFEHDISTTILLNQTQLIHQNLKNLTVLNQNQKISYVFKDQNKQPEQQQNIASKTLNNIVKSVRVAHDRTRKIIERFKLETAPEK